MIIDTHAHVDQIEDLDGALARAHAVGIGAVVAMSVDLSSMKKNLTISKQENPIKVHLALGIHPGTIKPEETQEAFGFIRSNIKSAVAVGETGLDYQYKWVRKDEVERQKQKDSFLLHLGIAKEFDLPIVIHSRGAWRDCLAMTKDAGVTKALFHWYSGPLDIMEQILSAGYYVSTSPSVGYSPESRAAMAQAPLDRILIETDSPVRYREGEESYLSEPKDVLRTLKALALLKNIDEQVVSSQVNLNARHFFRI